MSARKLASEVHRVTTPDTRVFFYLEETGDEPCLCIEVEDREVRATAGGRLDRDAAMALVWQLTQLCKNTGWMKE